MPKKLWSVSDISKSIPMPRNLIEFKDEKLEWHEFTIIVTPDRVVFGGCSNVGFLESGYILREEGESLDETLSELLGELEIYYNNGPAYCPRIVCNERM